MASTISISIAILFAVLFVRERIRRHKDLHFLLGEVEIAFNGGGLEKGDFPKRLFKFYCLLIHASVLTIRKKHIFTVLKKVIDDRNESLVEKKKIIESLTLQLDAYSNSKFYFNDYNKSREIARKWNLENTTAINIQYARELLDSVTCKSTTGRILKPIHIMNEDLLNGEDQY